MSVLLSVSTAIPEPSCFDYWCAIGDARPNLDPARRMPELESHLETAFHMISDTWAHLARELTRQNISAELTHVATCNTNVSDLGVMLAWSRLYETWRDGQDRILVLCDDPWVFRHLSTLSGKVLTRPPRLLVHEWRLGLRGYLSRARFALSSALAAVRLRNHRNTIENGAPVLLVYGHPDSDDSGHDAYFGNLMRDIGELRRLIHVDCPTPRALELAADGRTASLHGWGNPCFALSLPFVYWRQQGIAELEQYRWLIRRSAVLERSTGQAAAIRWQTHCLSQWLERRPPRSVIWPWENHGWERAFVRLGRAFGIKLCGYQHTVVGRRHWVHLPQSNLDGERSLPDQILCSGEIWRQALVAYGHNPQRLVVGGAHRFPAPAATKRDSSGPILLALPFMHDLAGEMVAAARPLAGSEFNFLVKDHPMNPFPFKEQPGLIRSSVGLCDLPRLSAVVYAASTVGLEAMIAGIPVVRFIGQGAPRVDVIPRSLKIDTAIANNLANRLKQAIASEPPDVKMDSVFAKLNPELWRSALKVSQ